MALRQGVGFDDVGSRDVHAVHDDPNDVVHEIRIVVPNDVERIGRGQGAHFINKRLLVTLRDVDLLDDHLKAPGNLAGSIYGSLVTDKPRRSGQQPLITNQMFPYLASRTTHESYIVLGS